MGNIVVENAVKREKGKLYYINANGDLCSAEMSLGRKKEQGKK